MHTVLHIRYARGPALGNFFFGGVEGILMSVGKRGRTIKCRISGNAMAVCAAQTNIAGQQMSGQIIDRSEPGYSYKSKTETVSAKKDSQIGRLSFLAESKYP